MQQIFGNSSQSQENEWISFSDLMAVLMVMFLFIAIIYFNQAKINTEAVESENEKLLLQKEELILQQKTIELEILNQERKLRILKDEAEQTILEAEQKTLLANQLRKKADSDKRKAIEEATRAIDEAKRQREEVLERQRDVTENFVNFELIQEKIFAALKKEFQSDLERWRAELVREDLAIRFLAPEVLFEAGSSNLSLEFEGIIQEFIPRYVNVLKEFQLSIDEIRVEGHTSSEHRCSERDLGKYLCNLELSQNRAREVAGYSLNQLNKSDEVWLRKFLTSNGLSSSKLVLTSNGSEDRGRSRRVY